MKNLIKIISLSVCLIMCLSIFAFAAFATDGVAEIGDAGDIPPATEQPYTQYQPQTEIPPQPQTQYQPETVYTPQQVETEYIPQQENYITGDGNYDSDGNYVDSNNSNGNAGSVSDYASSLYGISDINDKDLESNQWSAIQIDDKKDAGSAEDFSSIKDNKEKGDNGTWILYTGVVLIGLSILGIIFFIVATATYRKKLKRLQARNSRERGDYKNESRSRADYSDAYKVDSPRKRHYSNDKDLSYSERKRLKADTADIVLPRQY